MIFMQFPRTRVWKSDDNYCFCVSGSKSSCRQIEDGNVRTTTCYVSFHILTAAVTPQEKSEPRADTIEFDADLPSLFRAWPLRLARW